jgi:hypothetical protein
MTIRCGIERLHDNFKVHGSILEHVNGITCMQKKCNEGIAMYLGGILMYINIHECILIVYRCILKDNKILKCFFNAFGCI